MPYVPLVPVDGTFLTLDEIARIFVNAVDPDAAASDGTQTDAGTPDKVSPRTLALESPVETEFISMMLGGPDPDEDPAYWSRTNDAFGRDDGPRLPQHFIAVDRPVPGGNRLDVFAFANDAGEFVAVAHDSTNPTVNSLIRVTVPRNENPLTAAFLGDIVQRLDLRVTLTETEQAYIWGSDEASPSVATQVIEYHVSPGSRPRNTLARFIEHGHDLPADEAFVTRATMIHTPRGAKHLLVGLADHVREPSVKPVILHRPRNAIALDANTKYPRIAHPEELAVESEVWWSSQIAHVMGRKNVRAQSFVAIDSETCVETLDFDQEVSWEHPASLFDRAVWRRAFSTRRDAIVGDFVDWLERHTFAGLAVLALFPPALVGRGENNAGFAVATMLEDFQASRVVKTRFPTYAIDELLDHFRERPGIASELVRVLENPTQEVFHNLFSEVERLRRHAEFGWREPSSIDTHSSMSEWMSWCVTERLDASAAFAAVWGEENSSADPEDADHRVSPVPLVVARELAQRLAPQRPEESASDYEERNTREIVDTLRQINAHREADWLHSRGQESLDALTEFDAELDKFRSHSSVSLGSDEQYLPWESELLLSEALEHRPQPLRAAVAALIEIWSAGPPTRKAVIAGIIL